MTLSTQTVRNIGTVDGLVRRTGLPLMPSHSRVAVEGDNYISSRAVRRQRHPADPSSRYRTWIARMGGTALGENIPNAMSMSANIPGNMEVTICDPALVTWASITRTGNIPKNLQGGRIRFQQELTPAATLHSVADGTDKATATAYETRQHVRVGSTGTMVEVNKLAPFVGSELYSVSTALNSAGWASIYRTQILADINSNFHYIQDRYLNSTADNTYARPSVMISSSETDPLNIMDIYAAPADPVTLVAAYDTAPLMGSIDAGDSLLLYPADFTAAGITRWSQYFIWAVPQVSITAGCDVVMFQYSPVDIPPVYNCPGVDDILIGGYYS